MRWLPQRRLALSIGTVTLAFGMIPMTPSMAAFAAPARASATVTMTGDCTTGLTVTYTWSNFKVPHTGLIAEMGLEGGIVTAPYQAYTGVSGSGSETYTFTAPTGTSIQAWGEMLTQKKNGTWPTITGSAVTSTNLIDCPAPA